MRVQTTPPIDNSYLKSTPLLLAPKGLNVPSYTNIDSKKIDHKGFVKQADPENDLKAQFVVL